MVTHWAEGEERERKSLYRICTMTGSCKIKTSFNLQGVTGEYQPVTFRRHDWIIYVFSPAYCQFNVWYICLFLGKTLLCLYEIFHIPAVQIHVFKKTNKQTR